MDSAQSVLKSARSFFAGTLFSRFSGLFREIALAISFGTSPDIAAFMVSYRLANLFRRLLGEGNLQSAFVPHFASLQQEGGRFFRDVAYSMAILLLIVIGLLEGAFWVLRSFVSPDWVSIIDLTMWMVPGLFFICLYGLNSSLLQCRRKYFIPAAAPVAFNFIWIISVLVYPNVTFLAITITLGFAGQWLATAFEGARLLSFKEWMQPKLFSADFRKILKPLILGIIGVGAVQFNSALDTIFARISDLRGPTYLWYAIRIQQLPIALFGIALSGALLPPLSRTQDPEKKKELLHSALIQGTALMLVCTFGILAFGRAGIKLLYGHGAFTNADVAETAQCLWAYGGGLIPTILVLILAAKFYAEKNYRMPAVASLVSVVVNIALNALFVFFFHMGAVSIALATTISACVNAILLSKEAFSSAYWIVFSKILISCMAGFLFTFILQLVWRSSSESFLFEIGYLSLLGVLFLAVLVATSSLLKLDILTLSGLKNFR